MQGELGRARATSPRRKRAGQRSDSDRVVVRDRPHQGGSSPAPGPSPRSRNARLRGWRIRPSRSVSTAFMSVTPGRIGPLSESPPKIKAGNCRSIRKNAPPVRTTISRSSSFTVSWVLARTGCGRSPCRHSRVQAVRPATTGLDRKLTSNHFTLGIGPMGQHSCLERLGGACGITQGDCLTSRRTPRGKGTPTEMGCSVDTATDDSTTRRSGSSQQGSCRASRLARRHRDLSHSHQKSQFL